MNIAIYTRKSRMTDKGDSIAMQEEACRSYIRLNYPEEETAHHITVYSDEGFSGGNMARPGFKVMMEAIKGGLLDMLICYRLDRVSRNIADFSDTYRILEKHQVQFVSVKEQFDTHTPMGRAMLSIALVFSQLERETIAERIRDNLMSLGEKGQWLGGTPPLGYASRKVSYTMPSGKVKSYHELALKEEEAPLVRLIYDQYLTLGTLTQVAHYLISHHIKTRGGSSYSIPVLKELLSNPTYTCASEAVYDYYQGFGCHMAFNKAQCTADFGILPFNRCRKNVKRPMSEWLIALGTHLPIIEEEKWLAVQHQLSQNASKAFPHSGKKAQTALLQGLLYCGSCGARMKVTNQSILADGTKSYIYRCQDKLRSHGSLCNSKNAKGHYLDPLLLQKLLEFAPSREECLTLLLKNEDRIKKLPFSNEENQISQWERQYEENTAKISNLLDVIALTDYPAAKDTLVRKLEALETANASLKQSLKAQELDVNDSLQAVEQVYQTLIHLQTLIENASPSEKRSLISSLIARVDWHDDHAEVFLMASSRNFTNECKITHA